jgi:hypothetical protein
MLSSPKIKALRIRLWNPLLDYKPPSYLLWRLEPQTRAHKVNAMTEVLRESRTGATKVTTMAGVKPRSRTLADKIITWMTVFRELSFSLVLMKKLAADTTRIIPRQMIANTMAGMNPMQAQSTPSLHES